MQPPASDLLDIIECFWTVSWDNELEHTQENLPDPCVNWVFETGLKGEKQQEPGRQLATLYGPVKNRFEYTLTNSGSLFGIKFTPSGYTAISGVSGAKLLDCSIRTKHLSRLMSQQTGFLSQIALAEKAIRYYRHYNLYRIQRSIPDAIKLNAIVAQIKRDEGLMSVRDLSHCHALDGGELTERQIQRLFKRFIGIGPKQVIMKYRMQSVLAALEAGETDWMNIVDSLGFTDQAHFIKAFKHYCGVRPSAYLQSLLV